MNTTWKAGVVTLLLAPVAIAVGCGETNHGDEGSGGNGPGSGGASGGSASGGGPGSGGGTGGSEVACDEYGSGPGECGTCQQTVEEYCAEEDCSMPSELTCPYGVFSRTYTRGCGYLRRDQYGDVGDEWVTVWDESTGELVYHYFSGGLSVGCLPEMFVGDEPDCNSYVDACGDGGAGGLGGNGP